jgi:hypothetical protein
METIRGKMSLDLDLVGLQQKLANHRNTSIDIGTGDGRFVCWMAKHYDDQIFIGIDACRENLRGNSQRNLPNAIFIIASAQSLPSELQGVASCVSINFPWGSLLESLLNNDEALLDGLSFTARAHARLEIRLNGEALRTFGWELESGADHIEEVLSDAGWRIKSRACMDSQSLRSFSSAWAKRLAFGRDPRATHLSFEKV